MSRYLVNEIYPCLQGEGPQLGVPAVLVRFQVCNLRCTWCDTPYTHTLSSDPVNRDTQPNNDKTQVSASASREPRPRGGPRPPQRFFKATALELATRVRETAGSIRHVIFSGGEPTLYPLVPVLAALGETFTAEVESNGTIIPHLHHSSFSESDYGRFHWNISPKGQNAGCELQEEALDHWARLACGERAPSGVRASVTFKWVVRPSHFHEDTHEILQIMRRFHVSPARVVLMPEGTTAESQVGQHCASLAEFCQRQGMRYSPRLHVLLYGPERGR